MDSNFSVPPLSLASTGTAVLASSPPLLPPPPPSPPPSIVTQQEVSSSSPPRMLNNEKEGSPAPAPPLPGWSSPRPPPLSGPLIGSSTGADGTPQQDRRTIPNNVSNGNNNNKIVANATNAKGATQQRQQQQQQQQFKQQRLKPQISSSSLNADPRRHGRKAYHRDLDATMELASSEDDVSSDGSGCCCGGGGCCDDNDNDDVGCCHSRSWCRRVLLASLTSSSLRIPEWFLLPLIGVITAIFFFLPWSSNPVHIVFIVLSAVVGVVCGWVYYVFSRLQRRFYVLAQQRLWRRHFLFATGGGRASLEAATTTLQLLAPTAPTAANSTNPNLIHSVTTAGGVGGGRSGVGANSVGGDDEGDDMAPPPPVPSALETVYSSPTVGVGRGSSSRAASPSARRPPSSGGGGDDVALYHHHYSHHSHSDGEQGRCCCAGWYSCVRKGFYREIIPAIQLLLLGLFVLLSPQVMGVYTVKHAESKEALSMSSSILSRFAEVADTELVPPPPTGMVNGFNTTHSLTSSVAARMDTRRRAAALGGGEAGIIVDNSGSHDRYGVQTYTSEIVFKACVLHAWFLFAFDLTLLTNLIVGLIHMACLLGQISYVADVSLLLMIIWLCVPVLCMMLLCIRNCCWRSQHQRGDGVEDGVHRLDEYADLRSSSRRHDFYYNYGSWRDDNDSNDYYAPSRFYGFQRSHLIVSQARDEGRGGDGGAGEKAHYGAGANSHSVLAPTYHQLDADEERATEETHKKSLDAACAQASSLRGQCPPPPPQLQRHGSNSAFSVASAEGEAPDVSVAVHVSRRASAAALPPLPPEQQTQQQPAYMDLYGNNNYYYPQEIRPPMTPMNMRMMQPLYADVNTAHIYGTSGGEYEYYNNADARYYHFGSGGAAAFARRGASPSPPPLHNMPVVMSQRRGGSSAARARSSRRLPAPPPPPEVMLPYAMKATGMSALNPRRRLQYQGPIETYPQVRPQLESSGGQPPLARETPTAAAAVDAVFGSSTAPAFQGEMGGRVGQVASFSSAKTAVHIDPAVENPTASPLQQQQQVKVVSSAPPALPPSPTSSPNIVTASPDDVCTPFLILNTDLVVLEVSATMAALLGTTPSAMRFRRFTDIMKWLQIERPEAIVRTLATVMEGWPEKVRAAPLVEQPDGGGSGSAKRGGRRHHHQQQKQQQQQQKTQQRGSGGEAASRGRDGSHSVAVHFADDADHPQQQRRTVAIGSVVQRITLKGRKPFKVMAANPNECGGAITEGVGVGGRRRNEEAERRLPSHYRPRFAFSLDTWVEEAPIYKTAHVLVLRRPLLHGTCDQLPVPLALVHPLTGRVLYWSYYAAAMTGASAFDMLGWVAYPHFAPVGSSGDATMARAATAATVGVTLPSVRSGDKGPPQLRGVLHLPCRSQGSGSSPPSVEPASPILWGDPAGGYFHCSLRPLRGMFQEEEQGTIVGPRDEADEAHAMSVIMESVHRTASAAAATAAAAAAAAAAIEEEEEMGGGTSGEIGSNEGGEIMQDARKATSTGGASRRRNASDRAGRGGMGAFMAPPRMSPVENSTFSSPPLSPAAPGTAYRSSSSGVTTGRGAAAAAAGPLGSSRAHMFSAEAAIEAIPTAASLLYGPEMYHFMSSSNGSESSQQYPFHHQQQQQLKATQHTLEMLSREVTPLLLVIEQPCAPTLGLGIGSPLSLPGVMVAPPAAAAIPSGAYLSSACMWGGGVLCPSAYSNTSPRGGGGGYVTSLSGSQGGTSASPPYPSIPSLWGQNSNTLKYVAAVRDAVEAYKLAAVQNTSGCAELRKVMAAAAIKEADDVAMHRPHGHRMESDRWRAQRASLSNEAAQELCCLSALADDLLRATNAYDEEVMFHQQQHSMQQQQQLLQPQNAYSSSSPTSSPLPNFQAQSNSQTTPPHLSSSQGQAGGGGGGLLPNSFSSAEAGSTAPQQQAFLFSGVSSQQSQQPTPIVGAPVQLQSSNEGVSLASSCAAAVAAPVMPTRSGGGNGGGGHWHESPPLIDTKVYRDPMAEGGTVPCVGKVAAAAPPGTVLVKRSGRGGSSEEPQANAQHAASPTGGASRRDEAVDPSSMGHGTGKPPGNVPSSSTQPHAQQQRRNSPTQLMLGASQSFATERAGDPNTQSAASTPSHSASASVSGTGGVGGGGGGTPPVGKTGSRRVAQSGPSDNHHRPSGSGAVSPTTIRVVSLEEIASTAGAAAERATPHRPRRDSGGSSSISYIHQQQLQQQQQHHRRAEDDEGNHYHSNNNNNSTDDDEGYGGSIANTPSHHAATAASRSQPQESSSSPPPRSSPTPHRSGLPRLISPSLVADDEGPRGGALEEVLGEDTLHHRGGGHRKPVSHHYGEMGSSSALFGSTMAAGTSDIVESAGTPLHNDGRTTRAERSGTTATVMPKAGGVAMPESIALPQSTSSASPLNARDGGGTSSNSPFPVRPSPIDPIPSLSASAQSPGAAGGGAVWAILRSNDESSIPSTKISVPLGEDFRFGRSSKCTMTVSDSFVSSTQFVITRTIVRDRRQRTVSNASSMRDGGGGTPRPPAYSIVLRDCSANGTYVNVKKIGKGNTCVLHDNALITFRLSSSQFFLGFAFLLTNERGMPLRGLRSPRAGMINNNNSNNNSNNTANSSLRPAGGGGAAGNPVSSQCPSTTATTHHPSSPAGPGYGHPHNTTSNNNSAPVAAARRGTPRQLAASDNSSFASSTPNGSRRGGHVAAAAPGTGRSRTSSRHGQHPSSSLLVPMQRRETIEWKIGEEMLGKGGNAEVYLGINLTNGQLIAVKRVLLPTMLSGHDEPEVKAINQQYRSLQEEINVLTKAVHPNIVQYYGSSQNSTYFNILLEFVPGGSLRHLLDNFGALSPGVIFSYLRQALEGLHYLHHLNIVHSDIKAANILITDKGCAKLTDFGTAKLLNRQHTNVSGAAVAGSGSADRVEGGGPARGASARREDAASAGGGGGTFHVAGTLRWMDPAMFRDGSGTGASTGGTTMGGPTKASDIWSVGCTMIEMMSGEAPWYEYEFDSEEQIVNLLKYTPDPPECPECPECPDLVDIAQACLQLDPAKRPTCEALLRRVEEAAERLQAQAITPSASPAREPSPPLMNVAPAGSSGSGNNNASLASIPNKSDTGAAIHSAAANADVSGGAEA